MSAVKDKKEIMHIYEFCQLLKKQNILKAKN